jgi:hypothetical protein
VRWQRTDKNHVSAVGGLLEYRRRKNDPDEAAQNEFAIDPLSAAAIAALKHATARMAEAPHDFVAHKRGAIGACNNAIFCQLQLALPRTTVPTGSLLADLASPAASGERPNK